MTLTLDAALLRACDANVRGACAAIARDVAGGEVHDVGSSLIVRTGIPAPSFNPVFALDRVGDPQRLVEAVRGRLVGPRTPWQLVTTPAARLGLTTLIDTFGLTRQHVYPVMVLDLDAHPPTPPPPLLRIRKATDPETVRDWGHAFERSADAPVDFLAPWIEGMLARPARSGSSLELFLGSVDGSTVATSARYTTGPIVGVYFVQTDPRHRRRGYGRALTGAAAAGQPVGGVVSCLQSTAMGQPLYESMGYRLIGEYEFWRIPNPPAAVPTDASLMAVAHATRSP